ncbi:MauE/DoxX family redox-associated membrane protein [Embleya scabrispora]|uniref:MauE/DoxX family redox-associated membrane protein n=1 Tax=Embleya scabrispora TaxID=159449 RepID=UPI000373D3C2|nr:MauE/DoxX family redox-associated membrane protein [Embleya scabrispora]MYS86974.1 DoxX family membrane protein [Streptomyces sp. SID5474]
MTATATPNGTASAGSLTSLRKVAPWIGLAARLGLAFVWAFAGWEKALDPDQAAYAVRGYDVLPDGLVEPVGYALPYLELGLALLLVVGIGTRLVASLSALLLLVFIAGIAQAWARGLAIDCGCFGGGGPVEPDKTAYLEEILRDCGFMLLAIWLILFPRTRLSADAWLFPEEPPYLRDQDDEDERWTDEDEYRGDANRNPGTREPKGPEIT